MVKTTKAVVIPEPGVVEVREVALPPLTAGKVMVKVIENGICASDLQVLGGVAGAREMWVGHEFGGIVEEVGPEVTALSAGDRVAVWTPGDEGPGTFGLAEYAVVQARHCVPADGVQHLATVEPLACCINAVDLARQPSRANVVILGGGYMAQLLAALLVPTSARVIVAARRQYQLKAAKGLGAFNVRLRGADIEDNAAILADTAAPLWGGAAPDVVYETTGAADGINIAARVLPNRGTLVDVGYHQGAPQAIDLAAVNAKGLRWVNAHFRPDPVSGYNPNLEGFHKAVRALSDGRLAEACARLVTHRGGLSEVDEAFRVAAARPDGHLKTVFDTTR